MKDGRPHPGRGDPASGSVPSEERRANRGRKRSRIAALARWIGARGQKSADRNQGRRRTAGLRCSATTPRAQDYCNVILEGVDRIAALVEQVLAFSSNQRLASPAGQYPSRAPSGAQDGGALPELPGRHNRRATLRSQSSRGDRRRAALERVFLNLIRNAIEAIRPARHALCFQHPDGGPVSDDRGRQAAATFCASRSATAAWESADGGIVATVHSILHHQASGYRARIGDQPAYRHASRRQAVGRARRRRSAPTATPTIIAVTARAFGRRRLPPRRPR